MAKKTARTIKRSADMIHSDSELATKMEPAAPAPEAGPSNSELVENSHSENGASPVLDGDLKSPERANVNAMREALETQAEMEVGKPIAEKQEEIKTEESKTMEIDAKPGKQIIINIASWDYPTKKAAFLHPKTARFFTVDEMRKAGREYLNMVRTAAIDVQQGQDADGFHMLINMGGREYALYGQDAEEFRREYAAIPKPQDKVNALVEKYIWKLQPYGVRARNFPAPTPTARPTPTPTPKAEEQKPDIEAWLRKKDQEEKPAKITQTPEAKQPDIPGYLKRKEREDGYTRYGIPQNNYASLEKEGSLDMNKNKKANPMDTEVKPMAPVTIPSAPEAPEIEEPREIDDPVLVKEVTEEMFPGFDFAELGASQQRDVIAVARERKNEMAAHSAADKQAGDGMAKSVGEVEKEAGFNFFFPGQVTKEFYPELMHEIVDYPNANNTPMGVSTPEITGDGGHDLDALVEMALGDLSAVEAIQLPGDVSEIEEVEFMPMAASKKADVSTSPAAGMGIGRDGKPQVLEGAPLRKENDIRGPMFTDEFYGQYQGISGDSLVTASELQSLKSAHWWGKKTGAEDEATQFAVFLKKVVGEIAATMIAAFKVTSRPLLDKVPGVGEVQLAQVEQPQGMSAFNMVNTGSRVKYLMDKLNDSEIQDAINDAWAQAAVWHDGGDGGYVYEVFVRAESIDTDSMIMKYKFVAGTKE